MLSPYLVTTFLWRLPPHSADRLRIFKSAAWYALTEAELDEIFQHEEADVEYYIRGIVTAGIQIWKYEAAEDSVRRSFICRIVVIELSFPSHA